MAFRDHRGGGTIPGRSTSGVCGNCESSGARLEPAGAVAEPETATHGLRALGVAATVKPHLQALTLNPAKLPHLGESPSDT